MAGKNGLAYYDAQQIVDAPEHHAVSRALGILTWGTWDHEERPVEERVREFLMTFPPNDPTRHMGVGLSHSQDGNFVPSSSEALLARFQASDWRTGSIHELLARFGLKVRDPPPFHDDPLVLESLRVVTRQRNHKLRVLHGGVDIEPADMNAAKAEFLDQQEKRRAAEEVRVARQRMLQELSGKPES